MAQGRIIAVALLTEEELDRLGGTFTRIWPIDEVPGFEELLAAIDEADDRNRPVNQVPSAAKQ